MKEFAQALRQGLAHVYDTKYIQAGKIRFELIVSWGRKPHLRARKNPPGLYLNVRTMWSDLQEMLRELKQTLPPGGALPRRWLKECVQQAHPKSIAEWAEVVRGTCGGRPMIAAIYARKSMEQKGDVRRGGDA